MNESKKIAPQYYILSSTTIHTPSPIQADVWFTQISIFFAISSKKCKNKNCAKFDYLYILKSPYHGKFKYAKIFAKFSKIKFYSRKP